MAGRAYVFQKCQIAQETTHGTEVAASLRPLSFEVRPRPVPRIQPYTPAGSVAAVAATSAKEYLEFDLEGALGFHDLPFLLGACLKGVAVSSGSYTYLPATFGPETIKSLSMQYGSTDRAEKWAYGCISGLTFRFDENQVTIAGEGFGRRITEGATLTATPTDLPPVLADPEKVDVWIGDDVAGLALLPKGVQAEFSIRNRMRPRFSFDSAQPSFLEHVFTRPELSAMVAMDHDATASGLFAKLRAKTPQVLRIKATGPEYAEGENYYVQITTPVILTQNPRGEQNDLYASTFNTTPYYEPTFMTTGGWVEIIVATGDA